MADRHSERPFLAGRSDAVHARARRRPPRVARHGRDRLRTAHGRGVSRHAARLGHVRVSRAARRARTRRETAHGGKGRRHAGASLRVRQSSDAGGVARHRQPPCDQSLHEWPDLRSVPVRRLEAAGPPPSARARTEPVRLRVRRRRPPGPAQRARRIREPVARRPLHAGSGDRRQRLPAGARPVRARPRRPGRRGGHRRSGLSGRARAVQGVRCPRAAGARRWRRPGGDGPAGVGPSGLHHAVASVSARRVDVARAAARALGVGARARRPDHRGRLRQRVSLQRRSAPGAPGAQRRCGSRVRRHVLERDVPRPAARIPGAAAGARGPVPPREVAG